MKILRLAAVLVLFSTPALAITVQEVKSPGGLTAYLYEDHTNPIIAISFGFAGGTALDPAAKLGLSTMASSLLDEGAGPLDSFAYQSELEDRAINLRFNADRDEITGQVSMTTPNAPRAIELIKLALTQPHFDPEPVERIRRELLVELASREENPNAIAADRMMEVLFGNHPYARVDEGKPETLKTITPADLHAWVKSRFARDRILIAAAGDITPADLGKALDALFGALPATTGLKTELPPATVAAKGQVIHITKNLPQAVVYFGQKGMMRNDPDWYIATVDDYIFGGGGFQSRLMDEVREKRGLAYGVSTAIMPFKAGSAMIASVGTRAAQVGTSMQVIRDEWKKMHDQGPTQAELDGAKQYLTGAWPLRFTSTGSIAEILLAVQRDNLGLDYLDKRNSLIEAVTLDQAKRVARQLYDPQALVAVVVGPDNAAAKAPAAKGGK
jgi:zinc protease